MSTDIAPYTGGTPQTLRGTELGGEDIQHVIVADSAGNIVGTAIADPGSAARGIVVRNVPTGVQTVKDNVVTATGTISALNEAVVLAIDGATNATIKPSGTFVGTFVAETSPDDGVTWNQISVWLASGGALAQFATFGGTSGYRLNVSGYTSVRIRASSWTSGTATVTIRASQSPGQVFLSEPLPTGTNVIGRMGNAATNPAGVRLSDGAAYLSTTGGRLAVDNTALTQPVGDAGGSLTVDSPQLPSALVSDRLAVDGSGVTQPISAATPLAVNDAGASLTVDAPQASPLHVRVTDGTNNAAITNSEPTTSTYGVVTRAIQQSTPTYWATYDRIAPAANKYMAVLWNTTATRVVKLRRIWRMDWQSAATTSPALLDQELRFITARTGVGTTVTPAPIDTADTLTAGIEASHNATGVTDGALLSRVYASPAQVTLTATGQTLGFSSDERYQIVYEESRGSAKPITLRQNRGIAIKNITSSTVGTVSYIFEFTDEAV